MYLLPALDCRRLASITLQQWQNCITAAREKGLAKKTCQNIRGAITTLYRFARKNRVDMARPEMLAIPRNAPVGEWKILQPENLQTLFEKDWSAHRGRREPCFYIYAWRLLALTGLRRGELCGLRREDINNGVLHVSRSVTSTRADTDGKTVNARQYIMLSERMAAELDAQKVMLKEFHIISP